ncbi:cupin domain-containing protein [Novosphingopyxis sp.]|uniref:cupin domain-containing protein n=1 Tax=Novosphingopyxis sp. TaxID=2709690 RepID=UPI003B5B36B7
MDTAIDTRNAYYDRIAEHGLKALWNVMANFVTPAPVSPVKAATWEYDKVRDYLMEAGDLISAEEAERRVLVLENPGLPGSSLLTRTLYIGFQLILPGEVAPAHRHTQNALRFVVEGEGAFTAINGEKVIMRPYDLVLTPNMYWHDHGNQTDRHMIWIDGLDLGLVQSLDGAFSERHHNGGAITETTPPGDPLNRHGRDPRPVDESSGDVPPGDHRLFHYPFKEWRANLAVMAQIGPPDQHLAYKSEFTNPVTAGAVMATMSAFAQLMPKGFKTQPMRTTESQAFFVVEGSGTLQIDGEPFALREGTTGVIPPWAETQCEADSDLVLFSFTDRTVQQKLDLWREART